MKQPAPPPPPLEPLLEPPLLLPLVIVPESPVSAAHVPEKLEPEIVPKTPKLSPVEAAPTMRA